MLTRDLVQDPDNGKAVGSIPSSKVLVICHAGDNICQGGDLILAPHLTVSMPFCFEVHEANFETVFAGCWNRCIIRCQGSWTVNGDSLWPRHEEGRARGSCRQ
jgi:hypothetical protein